MNIILNSITAINTGVHGSIGEAQGGGSIPPTSTNQTRENKMKREFPNWLFIMQSYLDAHAKGKVKRRYHAGSLITRDGWIPNTFFVDKTTAGINGGARRREVMADYPKYFEVIDKITYVKTHGKYPYQGKANYDFVRIKPSMFSNWRDIIDFKRQEWLRRGVK